MQLNGKTYEIDIRLLGAKAIELVAEDGDRWIRGYDTNEKIKETKEVKTTYLDTERQAGENAGDVAIMVTVEKEKVEVVETGKMIDNPNYFNPTSLSEIEERLVRVHGFTK